MNKDLRNFFIFTITSLLLSGCAATGSSFALKKDIDPEKSRIIFYRPYEFMGNAIILSIKEDEKDILKIQNGQFISYLTKPSVKTYSSSKLILGDNNRIKLELKPNETYYVRVAVRNRAFSNTVYLSRVYEDEALEDLKSCCKTGQ